MDIRGRPTGLVALLLTAPPAMAQTLEEGAADPPFLLLDARRVALGRTGGAWSAGAGVFGDRWEVVHARDSGGEIGGSESYITLYHRF